MSTTSSSPAVLTSTLQALTAQQLIDYYPPPALLGAPLQQPSTDPAVYRDNPDYIKLLNEQAYWHYAVDVPNRYTADRFSFACKQWEMSTTVNGVTQPKSPFLPPPPAYVVFDVAAFNQWWSQYLAGIASGQLEPAPPLFFIKHATLPPPPVIVAAGAPPPPPPAIDGPIGSAVPFNPGVFNASANDTFPDGYMYAGPTGIYQKHIYSNPFTAGNVRVLWIALQLTPPPTGVS